MLDGLCQWCAGWLVSNVLAGLSVGVSMVCWLACVNGVCHCQWCVGWLVSEVCWQLTVSVGIIGKAEIVAQLTLAGAGDNKCQ